MWHHTHKLQHHITALTKPKCRECCHVQSLYNDNASGCRHSYVTGCKCVCTLRHCQCADFACDQLIFTITFPSPSPSHHPLFCPPLLPNLTPRQPLPRCKRSKCKSKYMPYLESFCTGSTAALLQAGIHQGSVGGHIQGMPHALEHPPSSYKVPSPGTGGQQAGHAPNCGLQACLPHVLKGLQC